jgi:F-type H+-transporting ATPase subunit delta
MADLSETARVASVLEDPSSQAVAQVYANSYLNIAGANAAGAVEELQSFCDDVLGRNDEYRNLLVGAVLNRDDQFSLVERTVRPHASELFSNFLCVLARHERLGLVEQIAFIAQREHEKRTGHRRVQVSSSRKLDDATLDRIKSRLRDVFKFEPILEPSVDASLLGGLVVRVDNSVYDGSLKSRLGQLAKRVHQRSLHEIQSGRDRFSHPEGD